MIHRQRACADFLAIVVRRTAVKPSVVGEHCRHLADISDDVVCFILMLSFPLLKLIFVIQQANVCAQQSSPLFIFSFASYFGATLLLFTGIYL